MKITAEAYGRKITIEEEDDGQTMDDMIENFIRPLLLALLYHPDTVKEYLDEV